MASNYDRNRQEVIDEQIDEYGYTFCQHCEKSSGVYKFHVHHIIFRSEAPQNEFLHDKRNLLIVCDKCHNGSGDSFHNRKEKRNYLIEKRKLYEIFTWLNPISKETWEH
jgi:5-methylcytosine-specific restriction endonuclease McrA